MSKEIKIIQLYLRNFKGVKDFQLDARGQDATVYGNNATGKTSIADAFSWLMFDKDSQAKKDFSIKTLNAEGQTDKSREHEVEAILDVGGIAPVALRKVYVEKWGTVQGSATPTFTGHTTKYFIDDVPLKKGEYEHRIRGMVDEETAKVLMSPTYFSEKLPWQDRRKMLLDAFGDVTDEDVIKSSPELKELPDILKGRKTDDHRAILKATAKKLKDDVREIPTRIDEITRSQGEAAVLTKEQIEASLKAASASAQEAQESIARIETGGEIAEKLKALATAETDVILAQNDLARAGRAELETWLDKVADERSAVRMRQEGVSGASGAVDEAEEGIDALKEGIETKEQQQKKVSADKFIQPNIRTICPTCDQDLPADEIEEIRTRAEQEFNLSKSTTLEEIAGELEVLKDCLTEDEKLLVSIRDTLKVEKNALKDAEKALKGAETERERLENQSKPAASSDALTSAEAVRDELTAEVERLKADSAGELAKLRAAAAELSDKLLTLHAEQTLLDTEARNSGRITELEAQEIDLNGQIERTAYELHLIDLFTRSKVSLLDARINGRFKLASFKLFDVQINEGIKECCETMSQGVPYNSGLNHAARYNVGVDIIDTMADALGIRMPKFIDNAEAITELTESNSQTISLVVSAKDKTLRTVVHREKRTA